MCQKKLIHTLSIVCIFINIFVIFFPYARAQEIKIESKKISYDLPYAGMLPDHPLFFLKNLRDKILEFAIRDQLKKAQLYLLFSDKRIRMAIELSEKSKWELSAQSVTEGERYFSKIYPLLTAAKKQGMSPDGDFILKLKLSIAKHKEVIESFFKDAPQGKRKKIEDNLKKNKDIVETISSL